MSAGMTRLLVSSALLTGLLLPGAALADEQRHACLSKSEQRAAIANGQAVTLGAAIRSARASARGPAAREVVKARLCREPNGLVYVLTVLARNGKVTHMTVDATSGKVVDAR
jgi:uncharacterized membrane protein YkoI